MPCCAMYGCSEQTQKGLSRLHRFPKKLSDQNQWIVSCKRNEKIHVKNGRICCKPFSSKQYDTITLQKIRLLDCSPQKSKLLVPDAVPDINLPASSSTVSRPVPNGKSDDGRRQKRCLKRNRKRSVEAPLDLPEVINAAEAEAEKKPLPDADEYKLSSRWDTAQTLMEPGSDGDSTCDWIDFISRGGLMKISSEYIPPFEQLEGMFRCYHGEKLAESVEGVDRIVNIAVAQDIKLPEDVIEFFFRLRVYFKIRLLSRQLSASKVTDKADKNNQKHKKILKITRQ